MGSLTGRGVIQKQNAYRSKTVTALAHESPCHATFAHECVEARGCDPAHGNWQSLGKGVHLKVSDWLVAFVCRNAHDMLDGKIGQDTLPKHMREYYWIQAYISSWDWAWREKKIRLSA